MLLDHDLSKKVSRKEAEHFAPVLANWGVLHKELSGLQKSGQLDIQYVLDLLRVELATKKRLVLATRLLGVYHRLAREENERRLAEALGDSK